ncbi:choice-of-anchor D domain-containing protein [Flavobacterium sangjuense]|nr:choice-of-anchor D domain-containing protein [Flavobacterium sangjuense]
MKKKLLLLILLMLLATALTNAQNRTWDFSDTGVWTSTAGVSTNTANYLGTGLNIISSGSTVGAIAASAYTYSDGFTSTRAMTFAGITGPLPTNRAVSFSVTGASTVKIWVRTSSTGRTASISDGTSVLASYTSASPSPYTNVLTATYTGGAGTIYVYCSNTMEIAKIQVIDNSTPGEINIQGNSTNIVDNSGAGTASTTNHTDFGTTNTGTGVTRTYTIQNTGTGTLTIGAITFGDPTNYTVTTLPAASVAGGGSTTFVVTFNPTTGGTKDSTISIVTNDTDENPYNFYITGVGTAVPEINIQGNGANIVDNAAGTSLANHTDFGSTAVLTPVVRTFTIYNIGGADLTIGAITLGDVTNYTYTSPSSPITSGGSATFTVTYSPAAAGTHPTTISIVTNDGDENPYNFALTGTGSTGPAEINIQGGSTPTSIPNGNSATSTTDYTDFGPVTSGVSYTRTFTIQNTGGATLNITGAITFSGTNSANFSASVPTSTAIAAGASATFVVTVTPSSTGLRTVIISIPNDDSNENPYTFTLTALSGNADINVVGVNGSSISDGDTGTSLTKGTDFGSTGVSSGTVVKTFTIENTGSGGLITIGAISFSGTNAADFTLTAAPASSLGGSSSTTFSVTFNPSAVGIRTAAISIVNNDPNENPYNFALQGTGTEQEINVLGNATTIADGDTTPALTDNTDFDQVNYTSGTKTITYTIQNTGGDTLTIGAFTLSGTHAADFTLDTTSTSASVAAGGSTTFTVIFDPSALGVRTAAISFVNNDANENPYNFNIQGTGAEQEINVVANSTTIVDGDTTPTTTDYTDFGSQDYTIGSIIKTYTIQNTGVGSLTIGTITLSGTGAAEFSVNTTSTSASVAAGASTTFTITFDPSSIGTKVASITIVNNDANENPYNFDIQGVGSQTFYDSDGDGINDNIDTDDDNDGITDTTEETNCNLANGTKANYKFLNEDFGAGASRVTINTTYTAETTYCYEAGTGSGATCSSTTSTNLDDGEYTVGPSAQIATWAAGQWYTGEDHTTGDTNGRMAMFNAAATAGTFYTATITGALPGVPITYSFWVINLDRADASGIGSRTRPNIKVEFRDMSDVVLQTINTGDIAPSATTPSSTDWKQFTASLNLSVNSFKVVFINNAPGGSGNDLAIDDILITQSLCDYDNDGVADIFDLDSDNDGVSDVVEAGLGSLSNGRGKIDATWTDADADGLHNSAEASAALAAIDSDGDGVPNYLDLDSDNDSVFDVDEGPDNTGVSTFTNGDGDITGNGLGDGSDTETFRSKDTDGNGTAELIGDGILDLFDKSLGAGNSFSDQYGNLNQAITKDTDGDGTPDYLDITSSGAGIYDIANNKLIYAPKVIDANNDGILDGSTDIDKDGILDSFDNDTTAKGSPRNLNKSLFLDFDGRNDYAQDVAVLAGSAGSLMAWIDLNSAFSSTGFIVGQDSFNLKVNSSRIVQVTCNGTTISSPTALDMSRWYHVAATYSANNLNLYVNGVKVATSTTPTGAIVDASLLTIGRSPSTSTNFFKGKVDEVRVFNVRLTDDQVQRMVYQELGTNTNLTGAYITGKEIAQDLTTSTSGALTFTNLLRYYRMDAYKDDILDNLTTSSVIDVTGTKLYNHKNIYLQQAPMPFVTIADGDLATAVTDATKDIQGTDVNNYSTIVNVKHLNTTTVSRTDLGLIVDSGKSLTVNGDQALNNTWWLSLNGKIDLEGKSQLVQNSTSDLDVTSAGYIERDQQGQSNLYNYNYWSSPVSTINTTSNNNGYTVGGVMKDGTTSTPQNITWVSGYNGSPTTPITLSSYWIFKFQNSTNNYANWSQVGPNGTLLPGQGYTLKGCGSAAANQNYTFFGKPNNGTITSTVGPNNLNLCGNPYTSAIDADKFIDDNASSITGTLYLWEHYNTNTSHMTIQYQGGYATYTKTGGTPPVAPAGISGAGSSSKIPKRFIPVGQGFFVTGSASGGTITFNNGQRLFIKEDAVNSYTMFRMDRAGRDVVADPMHNNRPDPIEQEQFTKIRLGYTSKDNYHRQILLGFMNEHATSGYDAGYDGLSIETLTNDMYFINGTDKLNINGDGYFNPNNIYPLGVKNATAGTITIGLDSLENFNDRQEIYIYDSEDDTYNSIKSENFKVSLPVGTFENRFSLRFMQSPTSLSTLKDDTVNYGIVLTHSQADNMINIKNELEDTTVKSVALFNMVGQNIMNWTADKENQNSIQLSASGLSKGTYVVKVSTDKGIIAKKILIK